MEPCLALGTWQERRSGHAPLWSRTRCLHSSQGATGSGEEEKFAVKVITSAPELMCCNSPITMDGKARAQADH